MWSAETLRRLTRQREEITRLDEYHEEVLLLFKFIFVSTPYSALSFNAIEKRGASKTMDKSKLG